MIQRVQSILLFLAAACSFSLFAVPFATTPQTVENSALFANDTLYNLNDNIALLALYVLAGLLAFVAIFLFRNRLQQILIARVAAGVNLAGIALAVVLFTQDNVMQSGVTPDDGLGLYTPIVGLVLSLLAARFIKKDENLVKSMDRLR